MNPPGESGSEELVTNAGEFALSVARENQRVDGRVEAALRGAELVGAQDDVRLDDTLGLHDGQAHHRFEGGGGPRVDQVGSAALYTVGPEYFAAVREEYKARRDALVEGLKKIPGVVYSAPKGAFYVMAALPVDDADKFQQWLLTDFDDHGDTVMFAPAESFYETPHRGVNEIRMAYVIKKPDLERAMEVLAAGIKKYNETR